MTNHSDLTFITNEKGQNLLERFKVLIKETEFFDLLVGYFYTSGFYAIYKSLEKTKKIRILIGISTNKRTLELIEQSRQSKLPACAVGVADRQFSHAETKEHFSDLLVSEMTNAQESKLVEEGVVKFLEWLQNGKLEIKAYPTENIHAKLYIMTFIKGDRDVGRVITGSSNFTQSGLVDNLEFNVELKNRADYEFAKTKFEELWKDSDYLQNLAKQAQVHDYEKQIDQLVYQLYGLTEEEIKIVEKGR